MSTDDVDASEEWLDLYAVSGGRKALAEMCHVNETTIWRWSTGERRPNFATRTMVNELCVTAGLPCVFT